jgi:putative transposase
MRKVIFAEGQVYHIYNRGTDKREVFLCDHDRERFVSDLYHMNNHDPVTYAGESSYRKLPCDSQGVVQRPPSKIVDILAFVLMPNHFHLMLTQRVSGGIAAFMHKLGTAYTMYFNMRYHRSGVLFQGRYKAIMPTRENHFDYIPFYLHANPLKLYHGPCSISGQLAILSGYKWSSYRDYAGIGNFPEVTSRDFLEDSFKADGGFIPYMVKWLENSQNSGSEAQPPKEVEPRYI